MPTIRVLQSIAAGAAGVSVLSGNQYEFLPFDARVEFAIVAEAASFTATVFSGTDVLQQSGSVQQKTAPATVQYPDDFHLDDVSAAGERITVQVSNGGGAAANVLVVVKITPI